MMNRLEMIRYCQREGVKGLTRKKERSTNYFARFNTKKQTN